MVVQKFIKTGEQFAYIRRYKNELKEGVSKFFKSLENNEEFKGHQLSSKGNTFYCDGKICGYGMTLSTSQDLKGSNFDKVKFIIFDEFIIEEGQKKYYLNNEVVTFLNLLETIGRMRDIKVFMLGNSANLYTNPYFLYFNLSLPFNNDIKLYKDNLILLQYMNNEEYREQKRKTKLGRLVAGTSFEDYAINNKNLNDNKNFIEKKHSSARFSFAFIFNSQYFGVWFDYSLGKIYVSNDYDKTSPYIFACTLNDHSPNTLLLNSVKKYNCWKTFIDNYRLGNLRFENMKIKLIVQDLIKSILTS